MGGKGERMERKKKRGKTRMRRRKGRIGGRMERGKKKKKD